MTSYTIARVYDGMTKQYLVSFNVYRFFAGGLSKRRQYLCETLGM